MVLVVDDNEDNRDLLSRRLRRRGFDVTTAASGEEALGMIAESAPDLVLLDVVMPGMSGLGVLERLRAEHGLAELPVILATALDSADDIVEGLELGANDYVTKPFDFRLVLARVNTHLALKRSNDQVQALNAQLEDAQERMSRVVDSASTALADVGAWARSAAAEVAESLGAGEVGVWSHDGEALLELNTTELSPPTLADLAMVFTGKHLVREEDTVLPVIGYSGQLLGALVVPGREAAWGSATRRLLEAFARQLGGALELRRAQDELAANEQECIGSPSAAAEPAGARVQVCRLCARCFDQQEEHCTSCGPGALLYSPWKLPRRVAGRYRLERVLGSGGMGVVFEGRDERLHRDVAVKVINPKYLGHATSRARFTREARTLSGIDDPGVVSVFDHGDIDGGSMFLVMELLRGRDLDRLILKSGPGTPAQVGAFLRQAASAIDAAHAAGIIHRDIKPDNFVLAPSQDGFRVKILDFGLARRVEVEDQEITNPGRVVGTPKYMSPEQAMGQDLDARTDIYSFAAVAYCALVGRAAVPKSSHASALVHIVRLPPPTVSKRLPEMPKTIDQAFHWALAKKAADRPGSAGEWVSSFVDKLERVPGSVPGWLTRKGLGSLKPAPTR